MFCFVSHERQLTSRTTVFKHSKLKTMHLTIGHTIEFEIIETVKSCAYGDAIFSTPRT